MKFTARNFNTFLFFKLPAAFITGVRVMTLTDENAVVKVKHRWINQNPFKSLYFAVLAMAAELATGVLVIMKIKSTGIPISMLVTKQNAEFTKKARGLIRFTCIEGNIIDQKIEEAIKSNKGQTFVLKSVGIDEKEDLVANFEFEWSIKVK